MLGFLKRTFFLPFTGLTMIGCAEPGDGTDDTRFEKPRKQMVDRQLRGRDITDERVLKAMSQVPRHHFVPAELRHRAYDDSALPIGHEQTISQPYIVAFMSQKLELKPGEKVLEIGTGSGYQAAVLAEMNAEVFSIEIVEPLGKTAREALNRSGYENVRTKIGDGYLGWPEHAPFDRIIVTASPDRIPKPLVDQLRDGGIMIIPVGDQGRQELYLLEKQGDEIKQTAILPVRFVPMTGEIQER